MLHLKKKRRTDARKQTLFTKECLVHKTFTLPFASKRRAYPWAVGGTVGRATPRSIQVIFHGKSMAEHRALLVQRLFVCFKTSYKALPFLIQQTKRLFLLLLTLLLSFALIISITRSTKLTRSVVAAAV